METDKADGAAARPFVSAPLVKKPQIKASVSSLHYIFNSIVEHAMSVTGPSGNYDDKLHEIGFRIGWRLLPLVALRERPNKREVRLLPLLTFISTSCWKYLFNRSGELFKSTDSEEACKTTQPLDPIHTPCH